MRSAADRISGTSARAAADSAMALEPVYARQVQAQFEAYRRANLNTFMVLFKPQCDEMVGRLCYRYEENTQFPGEHISITQQRERLIAEREAAFDARQATITEREAAIEARGSQLDEREAAEAATRAAMEGAADLRVPLVVDVGFGPNWAEAK